MVFATQWRGDRFLYYRHAPPPTPQDTCTGEKWPVAPFAKAPSHMRSVYYFWWAFLREHEEYRRYCEKPDGGQFQKLYRDFGVLGDDFMPWWEHNGRFAFCEPLERHVRAHTLDGEGRVIGIVHPEEKIILSIPAHGDLVRIKREIEQLIAREQPNFEQELDWGVAKYQVAAKPVLSSLHRHLIIWQAHRDHPSAKLHELPKMLGLAIGRESGRESDKVERGRTVRRFLRQAECIIEYVGQGYFPIMKPKQLERAQSARQAAKAYVHLYPRD